MSRTNYQRGVEKEYQTIDELLNNERFNFANRFAGSHGVFDVIGWKGEEVWAIQNKRCQGKPTPSMYVGDLEQIRGLHVPSNFRKFLWVWQDYKGWSKEEVV